MSWSLFSIWLTHLFSFYICAFSQYISWFLSYEDPSIVIHNCIMKKRCHYTQVTTPLRNKRWLHCGATTTVVAALLCENRSLHWGTVTSHCAYWRNGGCDYNEWLLITISRLVTLTSHHYYNGILLYVDWPNHHSTFAWFGICYACSQLVYYHAQKNTDMTNEHCTLKSITQEQDKMMYNACTSSGAVLLLYTTKMFTLDKDHHSNFCAQFPSRMI